ncbi:MAG: glycine--tRNA ligase subunit beta [Eggerthellaceae bacterium]
MLNLSEYPTVMVGEFDELFLTVPKEIIVDAMLVHQRYFPLFNADGTLANKFLITRTATPSSNATSSTATSAWSLAAPLRREVLLR